MWWKKIQEASGKFPFTMSLKIDKTKMNSSILSVAHQSQMVTRLPFCQNKKKKKLLNNPPRI